MHSTSGELFSCEHVCLSESVCLSLNERAQARLHWDALMFARSTIERDKASLALGLSSPEVQRAVTSSISLFWLHDLEPHWSDNPFFQPVPVVEDTHTLTEAEAKSAAAFDLAPNTTHHPTSSLRELLGEETLVWELSGLTQPRFS